MTRTMTAAQAADRDAARATLREIFPIGSTVTTKILHVSRSGMLRSVAVLVGQPDGSVRDVSCLVSTATGTKLHRQTGGVAMGGCGMDMGFALVYSLARSLYWDDRGRTAAVVSSTDPRPPFTCTGHSYLPRGGVHGTPCPSNDHSNETVSDYRAGRIHSDSGYALNHRHA